jgi:hypothetical protein
MHNDHDIKIPENMSYEIPKDAESIVSVQDENKVFLFGLKSHRKVFSELGYMTIPENDNNLCACAKALCDNLYMKPLINAMTLTPKEILEIMEDSDAKDPAAERNAAMVITAAQQAVRKFASELP